MRTCYLHIGGEKTGTTSLQAFLDENRSVLQTQGVCYPKLGDWNNHHALAACVQQETGLDALDVCHVGKHTLEQVGVETAEGFDAFFARTTAELYQQAEAANYKSLLLSSEYFQTRVHTPEKLQRLKAVLEPLVDQVKGVFYIRRQDLTVTSLYSTALRVGWSDQAPSLPTDGPLPLVCDYWHTCEIFMQVFGEEALDVRIYDSDAFVGGSLLSDFCSAVGVDMSGTNLPAARNRSLGVLAQRFLAAFNKDRYTRFGAHADKLREALLPVLEEDFGGKGIGPTPEQAARFVERFHEGNEAIRQRFFPDKRGPLFSEDYTMHEGSGGEPTLAEALDLAAEIAVKQQKHIDALEAELQVLRQRPKKQKTRWQFWR